MPHPLSTFKHCPRCGAPTFVTHDARSLRCTTCHFIYYHNAAAATAAIIRSGSGALLATRRATMPARGTLDLPGGFVEPGETLEEGCLREVCEETGVRGTIVRYLFSQPNRYDFAGFTVDTTDAFFEVQIADETAVFAHDDAAELLWIAPEDIDLAAFGLDSIRRGLARYLQ